jgi:hypothetical protein
MIPEPKSGLMRFESVMLFSGLLCNALFGGKSCHLSLTSTECHVLCTQGHGLWRLFGVASGWPEGGSDRGWQMADGKLPKGVGRLSTISAFYFILLPTAAFQGSRFKVQGFEVRRWMFDVGCFSAFIIQPSAFLG